MAIRVWQPLQYVKRHRVATALALLVPPLVVSGLAISVPSFADTAAHRVMVYVQPEVQSIFYSTSNNMGESVTYCVSLPAQRGSVQWVDGGMDILDGIGVTMITFGSFTCTDSYIKRFDLVGADADANTYWWVNLA